MWFIFLITWIISRLMPGQYQETTPIKADEPFHMRIRKPWNAFFLKSIYDYFIHSLHVTFGGKKEKKVICHIKWKCICVQSRTVSWTTSPSGQLAGSDPVTHFLCVAMTTLSELQETLCSNYVCLSVYVWQREMDRRKSKRITCLLTTLTQMYCQRLQLNLVTPSHCDEVNPVCKCGIQQCIYIHSREIPPNSYKVHTSSPIINFILSLKENCSLTFAVCKSLLFENLFLKFVLCYDFQLNDSLILLHHLNALTHWPKTSFTWHM